MEAINELINDRVKPKRRRAVTTAELFVLEVLLPFAQIEIECLADYVATFPNDPDHAQDAVQVTQGQAALEVAMRLMARKTATIRRQQRALEQTQRPNDDERTRPTN